MSDNNYEYNTKDYIEDKIIAQSGGVRGAEARLRVQCYERGDIENATRLKHGYKYKPHESTASGCLSYILIFVSIIAGFIAVGCLFFSCVEGAPDSYVKVSIISGIICILSAIILSLL